MATPFLIKVSDPYGTTQQVVPANGTDFQLEELQKYVGGYIDIIRLNDSTIMVLNDNGKFDCELNQFATDLAHNNHAIFDSDYISGDVVVCPSEMVK